MNKISKTNDPTELTERERKILAYRHEGHTYRETCKDLRVSATEINIAEQKEKGTYQPKEEKPRPNFDNYAEMYRLFSIGKQPFEAAIALNLPVGFVSEQYLEYLKSRRLYSFVQLYQKIGDGGVGSILLAYSSMAQCGYSKNPRSVGPYVKYCQEVHSEGINLEKMRDSSRRAQHDAMIARSEVHEINSQKVAAKNELDGMNKQIREAKRELARVNDAIVYQIKANPSATAAEAAKEAAERVLNDNSWMLRAYQEIYLNLLRNNDYVRWLLIPESRPEAFDRLPERKFIAYCQNMINQAAVEYFNCALNEAVRRASRVEASFNKF